MANRFLIYAHLATVLPAAFIGTWIFLSRKGTSLHRFLGKIYLILMLITGIITLMMPAEIGPQVFHHFGVIHLLSFLTIYTVPTAYLAARRRNIAAHQMAMISLYVADAIKAFEEARSNLWKLLEENGLTDLI